MCKSVLGIVGMNSTIGENCCLKYAGKVFVILSHKRVASFCVSKFTTTFDNRNRFEIDFKKVFN